MTDLHIESIYAPQKDPGQYFWFVSLLGNPLFRIISVMEIEGPKRRLYHIKKVNFIKKWWVLNVTGTFDSRQAGDMVYRI